MQEALPPAASRGYVPSGMAMTQKMRLCLYYTFCSCCNCFSSDKDNTKDYVQFKDGESILAQSEYGAARDDLESKYGRNLRSNQLTMDQIDSTTRAPDNLGRGYAKDKPKSSSMPSGSAPPVPVATSPYAPSDDEEGATSTAHLARQLAAQKKLGSTK